MHAEGTSGQVADEVGRGVLEPVPSQAVVGEPAFLDQGHEAGGPQLREVVLDRGLAQLQALRDLGQVPVAVAEEAQDPEPGVVAQRPVEAQDARRRRERVVGLEDASATG